MNSTITYRRVESAEADGLIDTVVALYVEGGWWEESPQARAIIPAMIRGSLIFLVAEESRPDGGRDCVGMARVLSDGVSDAYIQDVVVNRRLRGRGIGRELIARLVAACRERGIDWIGLIAEPGTESFYESLGFQRLEDHLAMRHA